MKQLILLLTLILSLTLWACSSSLDASVLPGKWKTIEWKELSSGKLIPNQLDFTFTSDDKYTVDYGSQKENGTFYLAGEYLHTKEDGAIEKSVRVIKLSKDSMIFEMNRAGSIEQVTLVKEKS